MSHRKSERGENTQGKDKLMGYEMANEVGIDGWSTGIKWLPHCLL